MAKVRTIHRCSECGAGFPKWAGRCSVCGEWNTLVEEVETVVSPAAARAGAVSALTGDPAQPIFQVDPSAWSARPTGLAEFDRVLGGGLVPGSVTLLGGEPGIGKSTLLLQLLGCVAAQGRRSLLVTGEESAQQVRLRAERLQALQPELWLVAENSMPSVLAHLDAVRPEVVVIDSIQTMSDPDLQSTPGSVTQVRECAHALVKVAKEKGIAVLLVGHVTKDGSLAGPRVLEHVVDTVLAFEGDRHHSLRLVRAVKHRFGATGELGMFEMVEAGLVAVADPSSLFLADRQQDVPGSIVISTIEGARPLLVEVQGLVAPTDAPNPRRNAQGLDPARLALLLAVIERRVRGGIVRCDVFASVVGGVRVNEPAADLGVALALMSSLADVAIPSKVLAIGEVGLAGEVRQVGHGARRLSEAARLGYTTAIVPASLPDPGVPGLKLHRVSSLHEAAQAFGLLRSNRPRRSSAEDRGEDERGYRLPGAGRIGGHPGVVPLGRTPEQSPFDDPF